LDARVLSSAIIFPYSRGKPRRRELLPAPQFPPETHIVYLKGIAIDRVLSLAKSPEAGPAPPKVRRAARIGRPIFLVVLGIGFVSFAKMKVLFGRLFSGRSKLPSKLGEFIVESFHDVAHFLDDTREPENDALLTAVKLL
jgi:hypothetical protein